MLTFSTTSLLKEADLPILAGGSAAFTGNCEDFHGAPCLGLEYRYYQEGSFVLDENRTRLMSHMTCNLPIETEEPQYSKASSAGTAQFFAQHWMVIVQHPSSTNWQFYAVKLFPDKVRLYFRSLIDSTFVDVAPCGGFLRVICPIAEDSPMRHTKTHFDIEFEHSDDEEETSVIMHNDATPEIYRVSRNRGSLAKEYPYLLTIFHRQPIYGQRERRDQLTKMLQEML